jgi:hypothetical protein
LDAIVAVVIVVSTFLNINQSFTTAAVFALQVGSKVEAAKTTSRHNAVGRRAKLVVFLSGKTMEIITDQQEWNSIGLDKDKVMVISPLMERSTTEGQVKENQE